MNSKMSMPIGYICYHEIQECRKCAIANLPINISHGKIPGSGGMHAKIVFVGQQPGGKLQSRGNVYSGAPFRVFFNELLNTDQLPIQWPLKKLIDMIELEKHYLYFTNVLKCSTENDRLPTEEEVLNCSCFLRKEIISIKPLLLIALGSFVAEILGFRSTHFEERKLEGFYFHVLHTYHPSYIMRGSGDIKIYEQLAKKVNEFLKDKKDQNCIS